MHSRDKNSPSAISVNKKESRDLLCSPVYIYIQRMICKTNISIRNHIPQMNKTHFPQLLFINKTVTEEFYVFL